jgi:hypothetical protein
MPGTGFSRRASSSSARRAISTSRTANLVIQHMQRLDHHAEDRTHYFGPRLRLIRKPVQSTA